MKYRIKDDKLRKAAITLFGDLAKEFNYGSNLTAVEVSLAPLHSINNELSCIFHPLTNELEIEPVKELEDGWNPYPETKPERPGIYLIAVKNNLISIKDNTRSETVDHDIFSGKTFNAWGESVFAWRELPKIWKGN